ncbi:GNAT family N-acetyltransferase [Alicyclobacillus sacchari]|uniref:GNAT family N-acetyltransferase n=1 Tax=Alicyclobacillus sacchari TaxID=392010 RepID=UPI0024E14FC2|nr:GNAT family N-acetyltransferase [Alicyclobacillus sacchari]
MGQPSHAIPVGRLEITVAPLSHIFERSYWPVELRKQEAFAQMIEIWSAAAWLGDGQVEVAIRQPGAHPMGYAALTTAFSEHPELGHAMEIGTYLAPSARGTGLNQTLKQHAWNAAKHGFRADWLIAAIPVANQRAARAYAKLPFPHLVYTGEKTSPWYQYWRRRQFAAGTPIALYITPLHD